MKTTSRHRFLIRLIGCVIACLGSLTWWGTAQLVVASNPPPTPRQAIEDAWALAQASGAYRFRTEVIQTIYPAPKLSRSSPGSAW